MLSRHIRRVADGCGALAAMAIVVLAALVLTSIVARLAGVFIGGLTEGAGYCMAAAGALGLAHTFLRGEHIRVDLVLGRLPARWRLRVEQVAVVISAGVCAYMAWFLARMVVVSWRFGDISDGSDALALWIPQLPVAVGFGVFALAVAAAAWDSIRTGRPAVPEKDGGLLDEDAGARGARH